MHSNQKKPIPINIGIYTGEGASHSWTWFAETFEPSANIKMLFLEENDLTDETLSKIHLLMIGGGDVQGMASAIGKAGAASIEKFVNNGGTYIGSCAGAYLVMSQVNLPPYTPFNLINAGMQNYSPAPPPPRRLPHKYKVPYGPGYVYNPVYGPVSVSREANGNGRTVKNVVTPLYGGPVIVPGEGAEVVSRYLSVEKGCIRLMDDASVNEGLIGGCAAVKSRKGRGRVFLFGPHFECPAFPEGFAIIHDLLSFTGIASAKNSTGRRQNLHNPKARKKPATRGRNHELHRTIKSELSNARLVAFGLERLPVNWVIGTKTWEPEKLRYFIEFARKRLDLLENGINHENNEEKDKNIRLLAEGAVQTRMMIRSLKSQLNEGREGTELFGGLIRHLKRQTVLLLETTGSSNGGERLHC